MSKLIRIISVKDHPLQLLVLYTYFICFIQPPPLTLTPFDPLFFFFFYHVCVFVNLGVLFRFPNSTQLLKQSALTKFIPTEPGLLQMFLWDWGHFSATMPPPWAWGQGSVSQRHVVQLISTELIMGSAQCILPISATNCTVVAILTEQHNNRPVLLSLPSILVLFGMIVHLHCMTVWSQVLFSRICCGTVWALALYFHASHLQQSNNKQ